METQKFVAADVQEALKLVKNKLGKNAMILSTKKVRKGTGAFGMFGKEMVEITASLDVAGEQTAARGRNQAGLGTLPPAQGTSYQSSSYQARDPKPYTRFGYQQEPAYKKDGDEFFDRPARTKDTEEINEVKDMLHQLNDRVSTGKNESGQIQYMRQEIQELKSMIHSMANGKEGISSPDWNANLTALYQQLYFNGLEEKFARRIIEELKTKVSSLNLEDYDYLKLYIARILLKVAPVKDFYAPLEQKPGVYAFVGVTGVGKTTSIAKIASQLKIHHPEKKIALLTLDNYRIGGVEQLKEYAKIIRAPFRSLNSSEDLKTALRTFREYDYVLIDTPGASQRDEEKIEETAKILKGVSYLETILVLNSTTKDIENTEITKRFMAFEPGGCVFTKLDEASTYGGLMNHLIRFKLPLYFLTTGQNVPDDIEGAKAERLIDLLLHLAE